MIDAGQYTWEECINCVSLSSNYLAVERAAEAWGNAVTETDALADDVAALLGRISAPKAWEGKAAEAVRELLAQLVTALRRTAVGNHRMSPELGEVAAIAREAWRDTPWPGNPEHDDIWSRVQVFAHEGFAPKLDRYAFWPARRDMEWYDHIRNVVLPIEAFSDGGRPLGLIPAAIPYLSGITAAAFFSVQADAQSALKRMVQGYERYSTGFSEFSGAELPRIGGEAAKNPGAVLVPPVPPPPAPAAISNATPAALTPSPAGSIDPGANLDLPGLAATNSPDWESILSRDGGTGQGLAAVSGTGSIGQPMAGGGGVAGAGRLAGPAGAGGAAGMAGMGMYPPMYPGMGGAGAPGEQRAAELRNKLIDDSDAFDAGDNAPHGVIGP